MLKFTFQKPNKRILLLLLCQLLILCFALGNYVMGRRNVFSQAFTCDDLSFSTGVLQNDVIKINESYGQADSFITAKLPLQKGVYQVLVNYSATTDGSTISAYSSEVNGMELRSTAAQLTADRQTAELTVEVGRDVSEMTLTVSYSGKGNLEISALGVYETSNLARRGIVYALTACIVLALIYYFLESSMDKRKILFGLSAIFAASCYPLFVDYLIVGHDLPFHLLRIEGIYEGLSQGIFPVKIHPVWAQDHGYAVGVYYGDLALYFPALLRIMGFSIQSAYQWFVAACNLGTVLISFFCFGRMFRSTRLGMWGCLLYTLSAYRLEDVYTRAACGEFIALMFLPVILCGFYLVFTENKDTLSQKWWKYAALIALGLTGVIQSHILSCLMVAIFLLLSCIIMIKKVCTRQVFLTLISAAGLTVLLNLGFLIPFLDYYGEPVNLNSRQWMTNSIFTMQDKGMYPLQLLGLFSKANGGSWQTAAGITNEVGYHIGLVLTAGLLLFLFLLLCCPKEKIRRSPFFKPACICTLLGALALYMSCCYFPWDSIASVNALFHTVVNNFQFPWRFLSISTVLLVFTCCYVLSALPDVLEETLRHTIPAVLAAMLLVSSGWYYYDFAFSGSPYRVSETYELNSMAMYSYEYLPEGTDPSLIRYGTVHTGEGLELMNYRKNGTTVYVKVSASAHSYLEVPLTYYKYYTCQDSHTGTRFPTSPGTNNMIRINLPKGYEGILKISFQEPWHWRTAESLSLFTGLGAITVYACKSHKKQLRKLV